MVNSLDVGIKSLNHEEDFIIIQENIMKERKNLFFFKKSGFAKVYI